MLSRFKVIVCCDVKNGFSKDGTIPWIAHVKKDQKFFKEKTIGLGNNAMIMGKDTFLAIPKRPLPNRKNVVISTTMKSEDYPDILIYPNFLSCLSDLARYKFDEVYVCGGQRLYYQALSTFSYLCDQVYVTRLHKDYDCDRFFPFEYLETYTPHVEDANSDLTIFSYIMNVTHQEEQYLKLIKRVIQKGDEKGDRTGVGTYSKFGQHLEFDISSNIPIITCKKIPYKMIFKELLWMISGSTNSKVLEEQGVNIWKENSSRQFLDKRGLQNFQVGDIGAGYGYQYRHWGANYQGCSEDYTGQGIDQLNNVITNIKQDPTSRRLVVSAWNVSQLDMMALPPCHLLYQFNATSKGQLDCHVYQRSADLFLGVPFNMLFYATLTYMVAHLCNLKPRKLYFSFGDAHIYKNHLEAVSKIISKTPHPWPTLTLVNVENVLTIDDFKLENFQIDGYTSWETVSASMAV